MVNSIEYAVSWCITSIACVIRGYEWLHLCSRPEVLHDGSHPTEGVGLEGVQRRFFRVDLGDEADDLVREGRLEVVGGEAEVVGHGSDALRRSPGPSAARSSGASLCRPCADTIGGGMGGVVAMTIGVGTGGTCSRCNSGGSNSSGCSRSRGRGAPDWLCGHRRKGGGVVVGGRGGGRARG